MAKFVVPEHGVYTLRTRPFRFQNGYHPWHTHVVAELCEDGIETGTVLFGRIPNAPIVKVIDGQEVGTGMNLNRDITGRSHEGDWPADDLPVFWAEGKFDRLVETWEQRKEERGIGFLD